MAQDVGGPIGAESGILARWLLVAAFGRIAVGETVIILHGIIHGTLAAWSLLFSGMKLNTLLQQSQVSGYHVYGILSLKILRMSAFISVLSRWCPR